MRFFGWIVTFGLLATAVVAGAIGYNLGLGANIAAAGVPPAYPAYGYGWGFGFFHVLGILFFVFLLFGLIFGAFRRGSGGRHHAYGGGYGPGGWWKHGPAGDEFERWHRRAHGEPETPTGEQKPT